MGVIRRTETLPAQEELLLDYAQRLRRHLGGRRAIHLHLSRLQRQNRRPQHLRAAAGSFPRLIAGHDGQRFCLENGDIVVVVKDATVAAIDDVVLRLRFLFKDDPLASDDGGSFCTWYDLERDYPAFLEAAVLAEQVRHAQSRPASTTAAAPTPPPADPAVLDRLETLLASADPTPDLTRQSIHALRPEQPPAVVFTEVAVAVDALCRRLLPDLDLAASPWLAQQAARTLDRRMLAAMPVQALAGDTPASLNCAVAAVLSTDFVAFDRRLCAAGQPPVVLELPAAEALADLAAYRRARDLARARGHRVCLDGVSPLGFPLLATGDLGFDFAKLAWQPATAGSPGPERLRALRQAVARAAPAQVILAGCDDKEAVNSGQLLGIGLFQGRYIDRLAGQP